MLAVYIGGVDSYLDVVMLEVCCDHETLLMRQY